MTKKLILDSDRVHQKLRRMALEIYERTSSHEKIVIVGILTSGFQIARILESYLSEFSGNVHEVYSLKINKVNPIEFPAETNLPDSILSGATLILVDDVQNSGKTMIYAIRRFLDFPVRAVQTCVLVDREHPDFPVRSDYVGISLSTTLQEHISVEVNDNTIEVFLS
jgi:pyrimidine operon attenuation protein/uracil phosphoribosyltransferase